LTARNPKTAQTLNSSAGLDVMRATLIVPDWPAPAQVGALMSTRQGGVSSGPLASLNLSRSVGDNPAAVAQNRERFVAALGVPAVWLHLVHGATVLHVTSAHASAPLPPADAAWTSERGLACVVTAADCLPVLFALRDGSAVAAAHAGWRGLAGGVLQATVQALCVGTGAAPGDVVAWLGPCIGPRQFEVGADVLQALGSDEHCTRRPRPDGSARWLADLPALARSRLLAAGLQQITGGQACTFEDASRFFSFRREGVTGRMAAAVWRR
jgi:polyphenol oxidase